MTTSMLEQAIIDAKQLREAAIKSAQNAILEKNSVQIKETVNRILEQDDEDMLGDEEDMLGMMGDEAPLEQDPLAAQVPLAATDGENLCPCPEEDEEVEIDFDELRAQMDAETPDDASLSDEDPEMMFEQDWLDDEMLQEEEDDYSWLDDDEDDDLTAGDLYAVSDTDVDSPYDNDLEDEDRLALDLPDDYEMDDVMDDMLEEQEGETVILEPELGAQLHQYHIGMGDPIYQVGSLAYARKPVPADLLESAVDNLESLLEEMPDDVELQDLISQLKQHTTDEVDDEEDLELDDLMEMLDVDYENVPNGWKHGGNQPQEDEAVEAALASLQSDDKEEENKDLKKALSRLEKLSERVKTLEVSKKNALNEQKRLKGIAQQTLDKLKELNLANAKLTYQNRILENASLNERQKQKLVESISKVGSVEEAKTVYEMAETFRESGKEKGPSDLREAISRKGHVLRSQTKNGKASEKVSPVKERMQRLAGILKD